jgi:CRISPR-associated protein Csm4
LPLPQLLAAAKNDEEVFGKDGEPVATRAQHNTLNRLTGTTGTGEFAPYTMPQIHYAPGQAIDVWCVLDEERCPVIRLRELFAVVGAVGYGRDASIGLGKFDVSEPDTTVPPAPTFADAHWTLGPCTPQGQGFDGERSFWKVITRFGRHGGTLALSRNPFKNPVLLAASGAVLVPQGGYTPRLFVGQGLTGVSHAEQATVHQGYAPALPLQRDTA